MDERRLKLARVGANLDDPNNEDSFDLDDLLHPAQAFSHPSEVVNDPDLTLNEKRAILASWASDACAIEAVPVLRDTPTKGGRPVAFDDKRVWPLDLAHRHVAKGRRIADWGIHPRGIPGTV